MRLLLVRDLRARLLRGADALLDEGEGTRGARVLGAALRGLVAPLVLARARRPLALPRGLPSIAVGGALLGGSGRTPVAIACTMHMCLRGVPTALVGHGYGGTATSAVRVSEHTPRALVGDEAVVAARVLGGTRGAHVVVGPTRSAAVALAARLARVVVLDGVLSPGGATLALLARPAGVTAPLCDRLGERAHETVRIGAANSSERLELVRDGAVSPIEELRGARYGLVAGLARPSRVLRLLAAAPVHSAPRATLWLGNHGPLLPEDDASARSLSEAEGLDLWVATEKGPLLEAATFGGRPLAFLRHHVELPPAVRERLDALAAAVLAGA